MLGARRFQASLGASAVLHGVALALALRWEATPFQPPLNVIPIALVARPGGGGGEAGPVRAAPAPPDPAPAASPAPPPAPVARPRRVARPARPRAPVARVAEPSTPSGGEASAGAASGAGGASGGGGDGSGGDGSGGARVAYGTNPLPPYPLVARRLGMEGLVLLDVLVGPDGQAAEVRVEKSSGFPVLDEAALTTVRRAWRFVPGRRGGKPIESRVTVPIRFRLSDLRG